MTYKKICGIYKITSPTGKIYVGKSKDISQRRNSYKLGKCKTQVRLYNSINKYGWENHTFEIVEECEVIELYCRERYWQDEFDVIGENGLNCILTACADHPAEESEETKNKKSDAMKGDKNPMYGRDWRIGKTEEELKLHSQRISESQKGVIFSDEHRSKLGLKGELHPCWGKFGKDHPTFGIKWSKEQKERHSEIMKEVNKAKIGIKRPPEFGEKISAILSYTVTNVETGEELPSVRELSKIIGKKLLQ